MICRYIGARVPKLSILWYLVRGGETNLLLLLASRAEGNLPILAMLAILPYLCIAIAIGPYGYIVILPYMDVFRGAICRYVGYIGTPKP